MNMDACINHNYNNFEICIIYNLYPSIWQYGGNVQPHSPQQTCLYANNFFSISKDANNVLRRSVMVKHTAERTHTPIVTKTEDDGGALQQ